MNRVPAFAPLKGPRVTVRPFRVDEFPQVWDASQLRRSGPSRTDSRAADRLRHRIRRSGRLTEGMLDLALEVDGRLIGDVQARHPQNAMPAGVFELGIEIYDAGDRGKGYGREALMRLTGWLFERAAAERVQAGTALGNVAMRRVLDRLGFSFEGVMRGFMASASGREDYALYAVTRSDWESNPGR